MFNENTLREEIGKTWGFTGAHMEVYKMVLNEAIEARKKHMTRHAREIVKLLHARPEKKDEDGHYQWTEDKDQMISIIETYLSRNHNLYRGMKSDDGIPF